ncbi:hypothetical protein PVAG01_10495 [Phlyctema vagabunda]|uniref:DUF7514 domain-containing protein n=1 Tax=Phlyctema vagabunda TaxID=108571 RepID=A0ABR4P2E2_9HELO
MSLFQCDGCSENIPAQKARIHCEVCQPEYNACANCYVIGNYSKEHQENHATVLKVQSGIVPRAPSLPQRPTLPPRPSTIPQMQRPETFTRSSDSAPSADQPPGRGWSPLLVGSKPTPTLVTFLEIVFVRLDTQKTGHLTPEQFSGYCDIQGYALEHDPWKQHMKPQFGSSPTDRADYELRQVYENFSIDHTLQKRSVRSTSGSRLSAMMGDMMQSTRFSGGMMPMLTRKGFIDIMVVEFAGVPSIGWQRVNRTAQHFNIWREWGDVPRDVLPDSTPADLADRIKRAHAAMQAQAELLLRNLQVEAELRADGMRQAQNITAPTGTYYRWERS